MAEELIVCNASSMDWLSIAAEEISMTQNPSSDTQVYHSVDELLEGVEQMEKESGVCQQPTVPTEIPNPVSVEVEVHQPPKSIVESTKRGRGRGVRGRGGRGGRGRGTGRGVKRLPSFHRPHFIFLLQLVHLFFHIVNLNLKSCLDLIHKIRRSK